jgi:fumarylacetoacetase
VVAAVISADPTTSPELRSWVRVETGSDFPIQNLPYGIIRRSTGSSAGIAIGDHILDLGVLQEAGLLELDPPLPAGVFRRASLNEFMACGPVVWRAVRGRVSALLHDDRERLARDRGLRADALVLASTVTLGMPFDVRDYVDFYSSLAHATNLGRILRPDQEPLPANWRHIPIGYHGRAGTVVASGIPVRRPCGMVRGPDGDVRFGPTERLDFELELGFVVGVGSVHGQPVPVSATTDHVFGCVLVNDWSARDIQAFEYQPLGPFLGKSFATSISPWVVPLDALRPYFGPNPPQDPPVAPYLRCDEPWALDLHLEVTLSSARMRTAGVAPVVVTRTNAQELYWTLPQQLAHATVNGACVRPGDLFASGTISGETPDASGSLIERTWNGTRPIVLPSGETRRFLDDGDTVTLSGWCEQPGRPRLGFGPLSGTVLPASGGPSA